MYLLWEHTLLFGVVVAIVPSIVVSTVIIRFVDLERYKQSRFGRYIKAHMTSEMQALRLIGFVVMMSGAWIQQWWLILGGLGFILFAWLEGLVLR